MADKKIPEGLVENFDQIATRTGVTRNEAYDFFGLPNIISGILLYFTDYEFCDFKYIFDDKDDPGKEVCGAEVALENYRELVADIDEAERVAAILPDQKLSKKILVVLSSVEDQLGQAYVPAEWALAENKPDEAIGCIRDAFKRTYFTLGPSLAPLVGEVSFFLRNFSTKAKTAEFVMTEDETKEKQNQSRPENYIKKGKIWTICFKNKPVHINGTLLGLPLVEYLIRNTSGDKKISSFDLEKAIQKTPADKMSEVDEDYEGAGLKMTTTGSTIDSLALAKADRNDLKATIAHAQQALDNEERDDIKKVFENQIEILSKEFHNRTDIHGNPRPITEDPFEHARIRVRKNVGRVRNRLINEHNELYNHLEAHLITGTYCYYISDPTVKWEFI